MTRRALLVAGLIVVAAASGCAGPTKTPQRIEGTWSIVGAKQGADTLPLSALGDGRLHLDAGLYSFGPDHGEYTVLRGTQPLQLDFHGHDGPNAGRTILAIFVVDGDTLTIAYDLAGTVRPTSFESRVGTRDFLVVRYRRSS